MPMNTLSFIHPCLFVCCCCHAAAVVVVVVIVVVVVNFSIV